jgi:hypothetical protein
MFLIFTGDAAPLPAIFKLLRLLHCAFSQLEAISLLVVPSIELEHRLCAF